MLARNKTVRAGVLAGLLMALMPGAFAASGGSTTGASFASAMIVSGSALIAADAAAAGMSLAVKTVETTADVVRIVLVPVGEAVAESAEVVIEAASELLNTSALAAGDSVVIAAIAGEESGAVLGHILTSGGAFLLYVAAQKPMTVYSRQIDA